MKVNEAYKQGLLKVGQHVTTNGSKATCIDASGTTFSGIISCISPFNMLIKRDDSRTGDGTEGGWVVHVCNDKADIKINSEHSGMKVKEAYEKGLLKVGQHVTTNGDCAYITTTFSGIISSIGIFDIRIKRDDKLMLLAGGWVVHVSNDKADIKINLGGDKMDSKNFTSSIVSDIKEFIWSNRSIIYTVAVLYLLDNFIFEGKFKSKLSAICTNLLDSIENKLKKE